MKFDYTKLSLACFVLALPLAWMVLQRDMQKGAIPIVRVAAFNAAMNRPEPGMMLAELKAGSAQARQIAEIVQRNEVDVLLLCELDRDEAGESAQVFARDYLAVSQGGQRPIEFRHVYAGPVNTGVPSGMDLDGDGSAAGPGDAFGYGRFPGQYGMALFSRHPIELAAVRTFQTALWSAMPAALRPDGCYDDATWQRLRLSSKSHWDVPIRVLGQTVHLLCSHPTPPAFDGPEDRNGCRNHDEIRFWRDYLTPGQDGWIVDDAGGRGGLPQDASFVLLGDLNCDPTDGDSRREALLGLLAHPRVHDPMPQSAGGKQASLDQWGVNSVHKGDPACDTGDFPDDQNAPEGSPQRGPGNLRIDYALPSRSLHCDGAAVFWPGPREPGARLVEASDHRLVFVDVGFPPSR